MRGVKYAGDVEKAARLRMDAQLRPGPLLENFFQRAYAAGQGDEAIGKAGHQLLTFVHAFDHSQIANALVSRSRDRKGRG